MFIFADGKYVVLPSGELQIRNVTAEDGFKTYKCRTKHRLTGMIVFCKNCCNVVANFEDSFLYGFKTYSAVRNIGSKVRLLFVAVVVVAFAADTAVLLLFAII